MEGSLDSARLTVLLLRLVVSQRRTSHSGQASSLLEAVKDVGIRLISANPIGKYSIVLYLKRVYMLSYIATNSLGIL